jgi:hypothetical protein
MVADDTLTLIISADDVRGMRFDTAAELFEILTADDDTIKEQEGKLLLDCADLESEFGPDPALSPQVRAWFEELDRRWPFLPYFLLRDPDAQQFPLLTSMRVPFQAEGDALRFNRHKLELFAIEKIQTVNGFAAEHNLDVREMIRQFCEQLHLDVIEEVVNKPSPYPFEPEVITSPFLRDFFDTGYYFHTIDASDEAVLYALVDDPNTVYYADTALSIELFRAEEYPVLSLELTVFDVPDNPLKMTFVYNIDLERHRNELYAYAEMSFLMSNFLYKEAGVLYYGFTRAIELPDALREQIRTLVLDAGNLLRAIPKEARDFTRAVEKLFAHRARQAGLLSEDTATVPTPDNEPEFVQAPEAGEFAPAPDAQGDDSQAAFVPDDAPDNAPDDAVDDAPKAQAAETESSWDVHADERPFTLTPPPVKRGKGKSNRHGDETPDILEEYALGAPEPEPEKPRPPAIAPRVAADPSGMDDQRRVLRSPYDTSIPTSVLPESIQRITKALSKPMRRGQANATEELSITPAPKKVISRDEDPIERLSRRLLIMQNNMERIERDNIRLKQELKASREEIERLQRENLNLESRWWKFWK